MEYVTSNEYLKEKGINLKTELQDNDNKSEKVERFIKEVTDWCYNYLITTYAPIDLLNYDDLSQSRKNNFKKGVIEQIEYVLNNGWLNKDSGVNVETGTIIDYGKILLSRNAKMYFWLAGFCNI